MFYLLANRDYVFPDWDTLRAAIPLLYSHRKIDIARVKIRVLDNSLSFDIKATDKSISLGVEITGTNPQIGRGAGITVSLAHPLYEWAKDTGLLDDAEFEYVY